MENSYITWSFHRFNGPFGVGDVFCTTSDGPVFDTVTFLSVLTMRSDESLEQFQPPVTLYYRILLAQIPARSKATHHCDLECDCNWQRATNENGVEGIRSANIGEIEGRASWRTSPLVSFVTSTTKSFHQEIILMWSAEHVKMYLTVPCCFIVAGLNVIGKGGTQNSKLHLAWKRLQYFRCARRGILRWVHVLFV